MKKKLGTTLVALATVLVFTACDGVLADCEECPTCPGTEEEPSGGDTGGQEVTHKDHTITFDGNEYVYVFDLPEEADKDEEINFKLLTESGFAVSNVSVTYKGTELREVIPEESLEEETNDEETSGEESSDDDSEPEEKEPEYEEVEVDIEVELSGSASAGYSFIMPDKDVTVHAEGLGAYFNCWYDSNLVVFTSYNNNSRKMGDFWHGIYEPETGIAIGTGTNNYVQAGRDLLIVGERPYTEYNVQLYANGEALEEVTDPDINAGLFAFAYTMPAGDVEITATAEAHYMNVTIDTSDLEAEYGEGFIDAYLYTDEDDTPTQTLTGQKIASDKPYVYAKINDQYASYYNIENIVVSWNRYTSTSASTVSENSKETAWNSTTSTTDTSGTAARINMNTKQFQIPSAWYSDDEITVSFSVIYTGGDYSTCGFVGSWVAYEFYSGSKYGSNTRFDIYGNGSFSSTTSSWKSLSIASVDEDNPNATLSDGRIFYNDGNVAIMFYSSSSSRTTNDVYVAAKNINDFTLDVWKSSNYIYAIRLIDNDTNECVGAVFANGSSSSINTQDLYAGVTIDFHDDGTTLASSSKFTITSATGETLYTKE